MFLSLAVAWSIGVSVLGYAARYLNRDNGFRKIANEAIYPFYLLHQPLIIILAYFILPLEMTPLGKALLIGGVTLTTAIFLYGFIIKPFRTTRLIFGMKAHKNLKGWKKPHTLQALIGPEKNNPIIILPWASRRIRTRR